MQILVVPKQDYLDSKFKDINAFLDFVNLKGLYKERSEAETDPTYLQIIPYIIVKKDKDLFLYSRLNKGNEARLHNKLSVGIGGHVDYISDSLSCKEAIMYNTNKELYEELNVELNGDYLPINSTGKLIYDDSNEVGRVHLGLLMICDVSNRNISVKETDKIEGRFYTLKELTNLYAELKEDAFETWTTIALKALDLL